MLHEARRELSPASTTGHSVARLAEFDLVLSSLVRDLVHEAVRSDLHLVLLCGHLLASEDVWLLELDVELGLGPPHPHGVALLVVTAGRRVELVLVDGHQVLAAGAEHDWIVMREVVPVLALQIVV